MFCTNCGHEVQGKFCTNCGTPVAEAAPAAPVAETPVYEAPAAEAPVYEAPQAPVYEAPAAPVYEAPAQPQYAPPQAPQYAAPAAPAEKPKKKVSAGKIVLFVLLGVLALIILLVAACSILVGRAANEAIDEFESYGESIVEEAIGEIAPSVDVEVEEAPIAESTGELVYYEGLTYIRVDSAAYVGDSIELEMTMKNDLDVSIGQVTDLMIRLYDANGDYVAYGNFFFDAPLDCYMAPGETFSFSATIDADTGEFSEDADLSDCSVGYEMMAVMFNDESQIIGQRIVTRMFELSIPAEWVGKVDYYLPDNAYGFYSIANDQAGADGTLFFIEYYEHGTYTGDGEYLGEDSWYEYYVTYPTGTAYDESDPELAAEYELFASQIDQVLYTVNIFE